MTEVVLAPAKLNLCLFLGSRRDDGLHEICSLFEPLTLADLLEIDPAGERDEVICEGVNGENLAAAALAALRDRGWDGARRRIRIDKRIPIAAGLGGGSADAGAVLRLARGRVDDLTSVAADLGADVPSQIEPALSLVTGAGERVERLPDPESHGVVLLPARRGLATAEVFAEADRAGLGRDAAELAEIGDRLRDAAGGGASPLSYRGLLANDLEPAAIALRPDAGDSLRALRSAGAELAQLTGSGPTAFGLFADLAEAKRAAERIGRDEAIVCEGGVAP